MNIIKRVIYRLKYGRSIEDVAKDRRNICNRCKYCVYNPQSREEFCNRNGVTIKSLIYKDGTNLCSLNLW